MITTNYGRLTATSNLLCQRGTFILDKEGVILHQSYHFMPIGRDLDAVIRELDAIRRLQIDGQGLHGQLEGLTARRYSFSPSASGGPSLPCAGHSLWNTAGQHCPNGRCRRNPSSRTKWSCALRPAPSGMQVMPLISPLRKGAP